MSHEYSSRLSLAAGFTEPAIRKAIDEARLAPGSHGLDAGCGVGRQAVWLGEKVGHEGRVTGVDNNQANLEVARQNVKHNGLDERIDFVEADLFHLPFENDSFDWAWCSDTLWPGFCDPHKGIAELCRVTKPGGTIALVYWSNQCLLPGYPTLEARLNAAFAQSTTYLGKVAPDLHFLRALGWLEAAGLVQPIARTFVAQAQAPLGSGIRESINFFFDMFWGQLESSVSNEDWALYQRLCSSDSPENILNRPDYYCFVTYTLFCARLRHDENTNPTRERN